MTQGLFQFNNSIINEILNFTISPFELFFMSGPKGSSKSEAINKVIPQLEESHLVFQQFCFDNTVIDDFLLNFYDALRNFSIAQRISLKKVAAESFKEKVSHYFKTINADCIIIVENFEKVEDNVEIVDFLSHLASYHNVKIIIVSRNSEKNLFRFKQMRMKTLHINEISKEDFKSKLTVLSDFVDDETKEKFYHAAQGLELYLKMGIKYCTVTNFTTKDLIDEFERKQEASGIDFEEFLVSKFVSLTPNAYRDMFKVLCTFSHPVSEELLQYYQLGNINNLDYLIKNFLVSIFKKEYYVKDYFRQYILNSFSVQEKITYYKKLSEIYEQELTKSPKDRLIRLSRESMRKELALVEANIPSITPNKNQNMFSYLGLAGLQWNDNNQASKPKSTLSEKFNKIKERKKLLGQAPVLKKSAIEEQKEKTRLKIVQHINSSRDLSKQYQYKDAVIELKNAMKLDTDNEFNIEILTLIAKNCEYLNEYDNAIAHYKSALEYADQTQDTRLVEILFNIARVNKNLYRIDLAKEEFEQIAKNENYNSGHRARAFLELGEIEEANSDIQEAIQSYELALELSYGRNKELVSKSYYKLAVLYDESGDVENAIKYYQKNYTTAAEAKDNKYYSVSLTNLALIYIEQSRYKEASEYLKLALQFDSENNDYENMYFSQKELGKLYAKLDKESAVGYFKQALESAEYLKDSFKEALVYFEVSELYYDIEDDKKALINLLNAKNALRTNNSDDENIQRINSRIRDIKMRLDSVSFDLILEQYEKEKS